MRKNLNQSDLDTIARLASVNSAKTQIPAIPAQNLLEISRAAKSMLTKYRTSQKSIVEFLKLSKKCNWYGAGITVLICMLAVETEGKYAPMDKKFAAGLLKKKRITEDERAHLLRNDVKAFAKVYVQKVLPPGGQP